MPEATRQETSPILGAMHGVSAGESLRIAPGPRGGPRTLENIRESRRVSRHDYIIATCRPLRGNVARERMGEAWHGELPPTGAQRETMGGMCCAFRTLTVGSNDGFQRKEETVWKVAHSRVGDQTWTIAD